MRKLAVMAAVALGIGALAACGGDDGETTGAAAKVTVEGQWARTSPMMASNGAAYMKLTSADGDALLSASVDASVAAKTEIHETVMAEGGSDTTMGMGGDTTMGMGGTETTMGMGGEMTMRPIAKLDLPAGKTVELKPGGYHIMMLDLAKPLEVGTSIKITLTFEKAGEVTVDVPVRDSAP